MPYQAVSYIEAYPLLLLGLLTLVPFFILAIIATITVLKFLATKRRNRKAREELLKTKFRPDGIPFPSSGRGMCDRCQKAFDKVFFLPTGRRLCDKCYNLLELNNPNDETAITQEKLQ